MKRILIVSLVLVSSQLMFGRQDNDSITINDVQQLQNSFEDNLDSMLNLWYVKNSNTVEDLVNDTIKNSTEIAYIPDSVYAERLARIPTTVKLTYNQVVRKYIEMYTQQKKDRVQVMLGLAEYYFPIFDDIFDYYGVPNELKCMSIIESALNPRARSRTRAIGVWQFMYGTGKRYGLTINSLVDERRDPVRETHAAAQFSKDLFNIFQDWQLVVAAYNCGPGNVNKAIRRAGGRRDFWEIYRYLPRETRGHVPAFIAAIYTMNYYKEHNLVPVPSSFPKHTDTIMVTKDLHLMQVAEVLRIPIEQLRDLNPHYLCDIIPARGGAVYPLSLPFEQTTRFIDLQDSIYAYKDSIYFNPNVLNKSPMYNLASKSGAYKPRGYAALYYTVKTGDNLGVISEWFDCSVNSIMDWNDLYGSRIRAGQKLLIYVPKNNLSYYQQKTGLSYDQKQQMKGKAAKSKDKVAAVPVEKTSPGKVIYYVVKQGDTLWEIAKLYPGISGEDIKKWNNLSEGNIMPGQKLIIKI